MKTNLSILTGVASLAALMQGAVAQSATTEPVGYITVNVNSAAAGLSFISPSLVNKVEYSGAISTVTSSSIGVSGTPFSANQFAPVSITVGGTPTNFPAYWVEVTSGSNAGAWTNVSGNPTTSAVNTEDDMDVFANPGDTIRIRKHVTINDFFGSGNAAGLIGAADPSQADSVRILNPTTKAVKKYFFYDDGSTATWVSEDFDEVGSLPIEPGQGLFVVRKTGATALSFTFTGHVKTGPSKLTVDPGINVVSVQRAVGTNFKLPDSGLNSTTSATGVTGAADISAADVLRVPQSNGTLKKYFFYDDGATKTWVDENFDDVVAAAQELKEGTSFIVLRNFGAAFPWTVPAESIAP